MESTPIPNRPQKLATISEVASILNVSVKTIYWWVNRAEIPFLKVGKHLRFDTDKVLKFFEEKTKEEHSHQACLEPLFPLHSPDYWSLKTRTRTIAKPRERE